MITIIKNILLNKTSLTIGLVLCLIISGTTYHKAMLYKANQQVVSLEKDLSGAQKAFEALQGDYSDLESLWLGLHQELELRAKKASSEAKQLEEQHEKNIASLNADVKRLRKQLKDESYSGRQHGGHTKDNNREDDKICFTAEGFTNAVREYKLEVLELVAVGEEYRLTLNELKHLID